MLRTVKYRYIRPMKIDIMFLVHNLVQVHVSFKNLERDFFIFHYFFVFEFCLSNRCIIHFNLIRPTCTTVYKFLHINYHYKT